MAFSPKLDASLVQVLCLSQVFLGNVADGIIADPHTNWISSSLRLDLDKMATVMGLDACLAIEYAQFGCRLMATIAPLGLAWPSNLEALKCFDMFLKRCVLFGSGYAGVFGV